MKSKFYRGRNSSEDESDISSQNEAKISSKELLLKFSEQGPNSASSLFNQQRKKKNAKESKGKLIIEVIDSGIGISKEGLKKLFKPFSTADKSIQAKYGGTGLGLWITNKIVNLMKGSIEVKSELNKGTSFII